VAIDQEKGLRLVSSKQTHHQQMMSSANQLEEFDLMEMGAAALIELAMGGFSSPIPQDDAPSAVEIAPVAKSKPSLPSGAVPSAPRQARASVSPKFVSAATSKAAVPDEAADVHLVLPRRKAGQLDTPEREAVVVTPEILSSLFQHPLAVASQKLGLSATTIKKLCRKLGINKWPYKSPFRTPRGASASQGNKAAGSNKRSSASMDSNDNTDEDDAANSNRSTPSPSSSFSTPSGPTEHEEDEKSSLMHITSLLSDVVDQSSVKRARIAA